MTEKKPVGTNENPLKPGEFTRFISAAAGLFWRMRVNEKKIEFLNHTTINGLAGNNDVEKLLQNLVWAQEVVAEEDFFRFKLFIVAMREGKEASVIFRIRNKQEKKPSCWWLRIVGAPGSVDPSIYYGLIRDITLDVDFVSLLLEKDIERQTMIESENLPVMLIDMDSGAVISRNTYAYELFGYTYREFISIKFQALYPEEQKFYIAGIFETCLRSGDWEGNLSLVKKGNIPIQASVKIRRLSLRGRNLLKISIHQHNGAEKKVPVSHPLPPDREQFKQSLLAAMKEKYGTEEILDTLLAHQYGSPPLFEAVMYADVYVKKRKVIVYARGKGGEVFTTLKSGTVFDFEGTVSQAIWENHLDFLILGDTLESTKPIDWALFIPHGVRSYFVKPFSHGDQLRTLLLFCSTQPNRFSEEDMDIYELYYPAFLKGLKNWRKKK